MVKIYYIVLGLNLFHSTLARTTIEDKFDHTDGVLDQDEALQFGGLTKKEQIIELGEIFIKIDKNNDKKLSKDELENWISKISKKYMEKDVENQFPAHDMNSDEKITWDEYKKSVFEMMTEEDFSSQDMSKETIEKRDYRRFQFADIDKNGHLNKNEFASFLHPEDHDHMRDVVIHETLEDLDTDNDGKVSEDEYLSDIYNPKDDQDPRPDWLTVEIEHFRNIRDKNKDNSLDFQEVKDWLMPNDFDHVAAEADHLIEECDQNGDELLELPEVLQKYDVFLTSQATNWGEALTYHEEL